MQEEVKNNKKKYLKYYIYAALGLFLGLFVLSMIERALESPEETIERLKQDSINLVNKVENEKIKAQNEKIKKANGNEIGAQIMTEQFVSSKLKSPNSAKFCSPSDYKIENLSTGKWSVVGWVDSQNSFGAEIRTKFRVVMQYNVDNDNWTLLDIATE